MLWRTTRMFFFLALFFLWRATAFPHTMETRQPFSIGNLTVEPGKTGSGWLRVPEKDGVGTALPVTVIHGAAKGKCLALVAGVHGYEYPPILALYRLRDMVNPQTLSGTLILVHIANLPAFQKRIIYYNPYDWKNLNRVFPGQAEGTLSQRIAYVLTEEVIKKCDYLIDLHCGDGNEALIPYTYWMISGDKNLDEATKHMALAFGISPIIIDESRSKDITDSRYLGNTAILLGKPAITTESGYLGKTDEESVSRNVSGILGVMRLVQMIEGKAASPFEPVWIDKYEVVYSKTDGLFFPRTKMGYYVHKGQLVGLTTDYFGNVKEELRAPFSGIILYIINTPPTNVGEPLYEVGRPKEERGGSPEKK
ncbi:MAG: M14 family metallopeptidase [Clostridiales bacterium]|nr:M14 family metallopeptidase [Clostridiales bacterium]